MSRELPPSRVWAWPAALAVLSALGLTVALLGDGPADALSWAALAVPLAVVLWYLRPSRAR